MKIVMIGGAHDFLVCHENLIAVFEKLQRKHPTPEFIALEYDKKIFEDYIVPQRNSLDACKDRNTLYSDLLSDDEIRSISACIGYDGDTHKDYFPTSEEVWLDEGATFDFRNMPCSSMVYNKLASVTEAIRTGHISRERGDLIEQYKQIEAGGLKLGHGRNIERDANWIERLEPYLTLDIDKYAFVIVGADHTREAHGLLRQRLRALGHGIEIFRTY
ncbi:hypothetical protein [Pseudodesulfovibrio sp. zrk46]|uniref:hypothetical protein n=1 Tax=Pseudodesulfovibrio sp. zrk46 TaxID=2725288 RepID=UPI00144915C1|nr:hypothetical protein [Pseudodesulfovibrio sp. zrk46]QJB55928.1 hypothetical protein HFN16_05670 [Pseudodesulfovibrio sp. zrk46]